MLFVKANIDKKNTKLLTTDDLAKRTDYTTEYKELRDEINDIENNVTELDYYAKVDDFLMEYYKPNPDDSINDYDVELDTEHTEQTEQTERTERTEECEKDSETNKVKKMDDLDLLNMQKNGNGRYIKSLLGKRKVLRGI